MASSTYSTFHSRSPTRAVTGPVEIYAFSTWNCFNQSTQLKSGSPKKDRKTVPISLHALHTAMTTFTISTNYRKQIFWILIIPPASFTDNPFMYVHEVAFEMI
jgi:hypothetical protein